MLGSASDKVQLLRILAQAGMLTSTGGRPDRGIRAVRALGEWGPNPAGSFTAAAIRAPQRIGVIDERGELTFEQIHHRTNAIARAWSQQGVRAGDVVALMARNHRGFVDASVAIAKLGAHVLYLNTMFAGPQIKAVCEREGAKILIHDEEFSELFDGVAGDQPRVLSWTESAGPFDFPTLDQLAEVPSEVDHVAPGKPGRQIILTSGTTGMPKGAQRPQPKSLTPVAAFFDRIPYKAGDQFMIAAPTFHAWGFLNWVLSTSLTGTAVLRRKFDAEGTLDWIARYRCNHLVVVPVMLQRIVDLGPEVVAKYDLSSLRTIVASGSALPGELAIRTMDLFGDILYNYYGSTEVGTATVATPQDLREAPGTAGPPARWSRVKILDEQGNEVPQGEVGRVFVGSGLQFEGYTGGGNKESVDGMLSSGDLGHVDAKGRLFIDGRDDDMIITGGENVFPREIEDLLADHEQITEASVIGVEDQKWGQVLRAFVVPAEGAELDEPEIKEYVKTHLAGFKVPREIIFLDALPRNATGKILKRELREHPTPSK